MFIIHSHISQMESAANHAVFPLLTNSVKFFEGHSSILELDSTDSLDT